MKKILFLALTAIMMAGGCKKYLTKINNDPNQFGTASPAAILQGSFKNTADAMATGNMNSWWDLAHLINAGSRYNSADLWKTMYVNVLEGIHQVKTVYGNDSTYTNQVQIARIWESYVYYILVANYGPVAKSQANNLAFSDNIIYDDENDVYKEILDTLKDAVAKIDVSKQQDKLAYDVIYGGDLSKWIKFGNTLRLDIALTCRRNLGSVADEHIKDVMANEQYTINAENESANLPYENTTNNQNPYYIKFKFNNFTGAQNPCMSDFLFVYFRSYHDPRLGAYFDPVPARNMYQVRDTLTSSVDDSSVVVMYPIPYFGRPEAPTILASWTGLAGQINPLTGLSDTSYARPRGYGYGARTDPMPGNSLFGPASPFVIASYAQSEFLKAEAAELGLGGSMSAEQYYNKGIAANFAHWGLSNADLNAYTEQDGIKWGTAGSGFYGYLGLFKADIPNDNLTKIWIQSWLNDYPDQAFQAWTLERRTRVLKFPPLTNPGTTAIATPYMDINERGYYPTNTQQLNPVGYADAMKKLGVEGSVNDLSPYIPLKFMVPFTVINWDNAQPFYNTWFVQKWYGNTVESLGASGVPYTVLGKFLPE